MTVEEMKNELKRMEEPMLQEITSFILQLRRQQDPNRRELISNLLDSPSTKWLSLEEMDKRLEDE